MNRSNHQVFGRLGFWRVVLALFASAVAIPVMAEDHTLLSPEWVERWRADLQFVSEKLPEIHPNAFHAREAAAFEADLQSLSERLPSLDHHEIIVHLQLAIARLEDGHTRLTLPLEPGPAADFFQGHSKTPDPALPEMRFGQLPLRLGLFPEGVFVLRAARPHEDLVGAQVVGIGDFSIEQVLQNVGETIQRDNAQTVADHLPSRLVMPEILHALGMATSREEVSFEFRRAEKVFVRKLPRLPPASEIAWVDAREVASPLFLRAQGRNFWAERLEEAPAVYLKFDEIENEEDETVADLVRGFEALIAEPDVELVVIDLRGCHGGDHSLTRPLLHALIRAGRVDSIGQLFVLTDRATFSAATLFALDLERHTPALFVGEPMSGKPKSYGDSRKFQLPGSGLTLRISTLYWQTHPRDDRTTLPVHVEVLPSFEDYRQGRDPVLEFALAGAQRVETTPASLVGSWVGEIGMARERYPMESRFGVGANGEWTVSVGLAGEALDPHNLVVGTRFVDFDLPIDNGVLHLTVEPRRLGLIGTGTLGGRELSVVLRRPVDSDSKEVASTVSAVH
ncbi:MAG: hypothetical protein K8J08_05810 [Thermoanaerobaculia bacterium]|nr:hypothetical protein [Thermoanaerobaculia bacterium]